MLLKVLERVQTRSARIIDRLGYLLGVTEEVLPLGGDRGLKHFWRGDGAGRRYASAFVVDPTAFEPAPLPRTVPVIEVFAGDADAESARGGDAKGTDETLDAGPGAVAAAGDANAGGNVFGSAETCGAVAAREW